MARGWESKHIEDQMRTADAEKASRAKPPATPAQREQEAQRAGLLLTRTRIINEIAAARDPRHRALLESSLRHLDGVLENT
jgi:hypothetical protein